MRANQGVQSECKQLGNDGDVADRYDGSSASTIG